MSKSRYWKEVRIKNWNQFDAEIQELKRREWLFRGHHDSNWNLSTSLDRLFDDIQPIIQNAKGKQRKFAKEEHERLLVRAFQKNANLYLRFLPEREKTLEWLAIMQHYGAPTRLLDVTLSPYIALYFALEAGSKDCSIFAFNHAEVKRINKEKFGQQSYRQIYEDYFENNPNIENPEKHRLYNQLLDDKYFITMFAPQQGNERVVIQQGLFLLPSQIDRPFEDFLEDYDLDTRGDICKKFVISAELRYEGLERLRQMNISSATLFPGIDGFCRSLKFQILETAQNQKLLE